MSAVINFNYSTPAQVSTITIGNREYRYGPRNRVGGWFIRCVSSGAYTSLPNAVAAEWFIANMKRAAGEPDPTPPTAPVAIRVVQQVATYAVSNSKQENIIPVNTPEKPEWAQPLPKPTNVPDTHYAAICRKCSGSGIFAMMVRNGQPWSATGTTCYPCNGRGWVIRRKPGKRAKVSPADSHTHEYRIPVSSAPTRKVGEWSDYVFTDDLDKAIARFEKKYQTRPTCISLSWSIRDEHRFDWYDDIPVEYSHSIGAGKMHLRFNPAEVNNAANSNNFPADDAGQAVA